MKREEPSAGFTVSLVGGAGRMGLLFGRILKDRVSILRIVSRDPKRAREAAESIGVGWAPFEGANESDIVIVSVPIDQTVEVCQSLGHRMKPRSLLVDLASVKTGITDAVTDSTPTNVEYLSLHPLFGPQIQSIAEKRFIAIEARAGPMTDAFLRTLLDCGARIGKATVEQHDHAMAAVQVLHHHALLTYASTLSRVAAHTDLSAYVTESLERTIHNLQSMQENWKTIYSIQRRNPHARGIREAFAGAAADLVELDEDSKTSLKRSLSILRLQGKRQSG